MTTRDPYRNYKWEVEIDGFARAGFSECEGLERETEVIEYREAGENESPHKLPGQTTFTELTLSRGMSNDSDFVDWCSKIFDIQSKDGNQGDDDFRKNISIHVKNKAGNRVKTWRIYRVWPSGLKSEKLDANANDVLLERLVLQNEGQNLKNRA